MVDVVPLVEAVAATVEDCDVLAAFGGSAFFVTLPSFASIISRRFCSKAGSLTQSCNFPSMLNGALLRGSTLTLVAYV